MRRICKTGVLVLALAACAPTEMRRPARLTYDAPDTPSAPIRETPAPPPAAFVPSALQSTKPSDIKVVDRATLENYEVVVWEEPKKPRTKKIKVVKGDTLYSLANKHNVKVYDLAEENGLKAPFILRPGTEISVPDDSGTTPEPKKQATLVHGLDSSKSFIEEPAKSEIQIKKGDTLYSVARANNVPLKDLIEANDLKAPYSLSIGQTLQLPSTAFHIVSKGDTMYSISRQYGVNLNSLAKMNSMEPPYSISVGQKLALPASTAPTPTSTENVVVKKDSGEAKVVSVERPKPTLTKKIESPAPAPVAIAKPEPMSGAKFLWPVNGKVVAEFGTKSAGNRNDGINIAAPLGSPVLAAENGIVAYAGNELKGLGNLVIIKHDQGYMTIYSHNDKLLVGKGEKVSRGAKIAEVGKTGRVSTPQLHFEIRQKTKSIDPSSMLAKK